MCVLFHDEDPNIRPIHFLSVCVVLFVFMEYNFISLLVKELVLGITFHVVVISICMRGSVLRPLVRLMGVFILPLIAVGVTLVFGVDPDFRPQIVAELVIQIVVVHTLIHLKLILKIMDHKSLQPTDTYQ